MMDFNHFVEWAFLGMIGGGLSLVAIFLAKINDSVATLNVQVGIVLTRLASQEKDLNNHENRITNLEKRGHRHG